MYERGVCEPALKFPRMWEGSGRTSQGQNPAWAGEIRPSGIVGGLTETRVMVELKTRRTTERVRVGNSPPNAACAVFLSRPLNSYM